MFFLFLLYSFSLSGNPVIVSSGSFQGLAYENGEIIIPPVYDAIGWSDGNVQVQGELIGFKENNQWGLINLKNKKISGPTFIELKPFEHGYFLAAIKGRFTNLPFYGLLDKNGQTIVRFNYMQLSPLGSENILAASYEQGHVYYGVVNYQGEELIPPIYDKIELDGEVLIATKKNKVKVYHLSGRQITPAFIEGIKVVPVGYSLEDGGQFGLLSKHGDWIHKVKFKSIVDHAAYNFNHWEVSCLRNDCNQFEISADSLMLNERQQLVAHLNNTQHFLGGDSALHFGKKYKIQSVQRGFLVMQNRFDGSYALFKTDGKKIIDGQDDLIVDDQYFYCKKEEGWKVLDNFGKLINNQKYDSVGHSHDSKIPTRKNGYWGWTDFTGEKVINYKYDFVGSGVVDDQFIARYINSWGVVSFHDDFIIPPNFDSIFTAGRYYLAKMGSATSIFSSEGSLLIKTGDKVIYDSDNSLIKILDEDGRSFIMTEEGQLLPSKYDDAIKMGRFILLNSKGYFTIFENDNYILSPSDKVENVLGFASGFFHIIKDGKHGFVDLQGNLRIANRYEDARDYQSGLAAVKIGKGWGFIDASERLVIQPHYAEVSSFSDGLAIAKENGKYGLLDSQGKNIVSFSWEHIERLITGNYLLTSLNGKKGLADNEGKIILRPNYEELLDTPQGLVVATKGSFKGVLDYNGYTKTPFDYKEIRILGDYLLLLKIKEYVPNQPSPY